MSFLKLNEAVKNQKLDGPVKPIRKLTHGACIPLLDRGDNRGTG